MPKLDLPDATALRQQMEAGERTAVSVVTEYLDRLEANHGRLNAATKVFWERALEEARQPRPGPLSGIPISVKETFGMAGETITVGSQRRVPTYCQEDSTIVQRLRQAGAIIIARSNIPEMALAGESENPLYGRTNNPLDPERTCGGSSGGEGALVGSGSTVLGVGSDILGSIRIPAAFCGLVGFKPRSGAVPGAGIWPELGDAHTGGWLAIGPITRSVRDARLVYNSIADEPLPERRSPAGLRLIIPQGFEMAIDADCIKAALVETQTVLELEGMVAEERPFPDIGKLFIHLQTMVAHDLEPAVLAELTTAAGKTFSLAAELARQAIGQPTIYSGLFQLLLAAPIIRPRTPEQVETAVSAIMAARAHYQEMLGDDGILLLPTLGKLAPKHGHMNRSSLRPGVVGQVTSLTFPNYLDLPAISIPAWNDVDEATGLPASVMLVCAPGAEARLLDAAAMLEEAIG
jgi:Asp-tRNA(Asn)/Glu-tRNA(Gln) amidotransferase A subunit family amidase